jgi:hypothetical protein
MIWVVATFCLGYVVGLYSIIFGVVALVRGKMPSSWWGEIKGDKAVSLALICILLGLLLIVAPCFYPG